MPTPSTPPNLAAPDHRRDERVREAPVRRMGNRVLEVRVVIA